MDGDMHGSLQALICILVVAGCVLSFVRWLSKWGQLEARYKCHRAAMRDRMSTGSYRGVSSRFGLVSMRLAVELYPDVLYIRPGNPYTWFLKPICIPWESIEVIAQKRWLVSRTTTIRLPDYPHFIHIHGEPARKVAERISQRVGLAESGD